MLNGMGASQIGDEKEAYAPVNSCRPYGGQPGRSSILEKTGSTEIGRKFDGSDFDPAL